MSWLCKLLLCSMLISNTASAGEAATAHGQTIADSARWHIDNPPELRGQMSGELVQRMLETAGFPKLEPMSAQTLWLGPFGRRHYSSRPDVGDLVFFSATEPSTDARVTHGAHVAEVGVVIDVDELGNITFVTRDSGGTTAQLGALNLEEQQGSDDFHGFVSLNRTWLPAKDDPIPAFSATGLSVDLDLRDLGDAPTRIALDGDELTRAHLSGQSCMGLWAVRNTVLARHGYRFESRAAKLYFAARRWYEPDQQVDRRTVDGWLTVTDRSNLELVQHLEYRAGCDAMAMR